AAAATRTRGKTMDGPLAGLRVVEFADEMGRFAGKLLAESGASVVQLTQGFSGPPMQLPAANRGGVLDWWYDGGKKHLGVALGTAGHASSAGGREHYNFGSFMACICGLAGLHSAREGGPGQHIDVSLHEVMTSSIENLFFQWWFPDLLPIPQRALRQGSLHW